jgi:hypothetical protein
VYISDTVGAAKDWMMMGTHSISKVGWFSRILEVFQLGWMMMGRPEYSS